MIQQILGTGMALAGLGAIVYTSYMILLARRSEGWPTAPGTILSADVERRGGGGGDFHTNHMVFAANITYEYEIRGHKLRGEKICSGGELNTSFRSRAEERCRRYSPGRSVQVHYKPGDPSICCLEPTTELGPLVYAIGTAFAILGVVIAMS